MGRVRRRRRCAACASPRTTDNWRRIAHQIADAIYERITGEARYFDTRIVYVAETGPAHRRIKRLAIMDQDGANHRFLTDGGAGADAALLPERRQITYMAYRGRGRRSICSNVDTGASSSSATSPA